MDIEITRREDGGAGLYLAELGGKGAGELAYRRQGDRVTVTHTEAYPAFRGKGVAYALVERLAADARREDFKILPLCWYARDKLKERAEWRELIEGGE